MKNGHFAFLSTPLGAQGQCMVFILGSERLHNRYTVSATAFTRLQHVKCTDSVIMPQAHWKARSGLPIGDN